MDRVEKVGLGAAIGGHVILLGAFGLGLLASADTIKKQESISVSLVGEIADVSTAPDAIQEESAPPAAGDTAPSELPARLEEIASAQDAAKPRQIMLRGDTSISYGQMMRVMGELNRAGLNSVSLVTTGSSGEN